MGNQYIYTHYTFIGYHNTNENFEFNDSFIGNISSSVGIAILASFSAQHSYIYVL